MKYYIYNKEEFFAKGEGEFAKMTERHRVYEQKENIENSGIFLKKPLDNGESIW